MLRLVICDDQAITRDGLAMLLALENDMQIVGCASSGADAIRLVAQLAPDLVLMDLKMPGMNGVEATREIRARHAGIKVLVLTTYSDDTWVMEALRAGAAGYLLKDAPREALVAAIRGTVAGKTYVDPQVAGQLLSQIIQPGPQPASALQEKLSERELALLSQIVAGMTNTQLADYFGLSEGTVRNYVSVILAKLGVSDRTQAAVLALKLGLVRSL